MPSNLEHLWLWVALFWLIGPRVPFLRPSGRLNGLAPDLVRIGTWFAGFTFLLWLTQLWVGAPSAPDPASWPSPQRWIALLIIVSAFGTLLWWAVGRGGAASMADALDVAPSIVMAVLALLVTVGAVSIGNSYSGCALYGGDTIAHCETAEAAG